MNSHGATDAELQVYIQEFDGKKIVNVKIFDKVIN